MSSSILGTDSRLLQNDCRNRRTDFNDPLYINAGDGISA